MLGAKILSLEMANVSFRDVKISLRTVKNNRHDINSKQKNSKKTIYIDRGQPNIANDDAVIPIFDWFSNRTLTISRYTNAFVRRT